MRYTDAYSACGPIVAASEGIARFTLGWGSGAKCMTDRDSRAQLRFPGVHTPAVTETTLEAMLARCRQQPPDATSTGSDPAVSGGQFRVVLSGALCASGSASVGLNSTIFVGPEDVSLAASAAANGAQRLCVQLRVPFAQRH